MKYFQFFPHKSSFSELTLPNWVRLGSIKKFKVKLDQPDLTSQVWLKEVCLITKFWWSLKFSNRFFKWINQVLFLSNSSMSWEKCRREWFKIKQEYVFTKSSTISKRFEIINLVLNANILKGCRYLGELFSSYFSSLQEIITWKRFGCAGVSRKFFHHVNDIKNDPARLVRPGMTHTYEDRLAQTSQVHHR